MQTLCALAKKQNATAKQVRVKLVEDTYDIWIAATAANVGAIVLTHDVHFEQIQRVGSIILSKTSA